MSPFVRFFCFFFVLNFYSYILFLIFPARLDGSNIALLGFYWLITSTVLMGASKMMTASSWIYVILNNPTELWKMQFGEKSSPETERFYQR